jgi:cobalt-zinc-cadmium resistance protein CzcA
MIPTNTGNQIPLSQVANISYKLGPSQISREASKRRIVIGFNVSGRDVQSVVEDIQQKLSEQIKLPTGYYFTYGGQFENLQKASKRLMIELTVSLYFSIFSCAVLYIQFTQNRQCLIFTRNPYDSA